MPLPPSQTPPKVPPKPSHLGPVQKRQLRKESSLPPQPPNMSLRREASFDSVASGGPNGPAGGSVRSFRSVSNMSRIPVWQGSQESLAAATSCSNLKEVSLTWDGITGLFSGPGRTFVDFIL